jgi:hypothetical protein
VGVRIPRGAPLYARIRYFPREAPFFALPFAYIEDCPIAAWQTLGHGDRLFHTRETADKLADAGQDRLLIAREGAVTGAMKAPINWPLQSYSIVAPVQERSRRDC